MKAQPIKLFRGDNQSICVKNNKTQKIERVKRFRAREMVAKGTWTYTSLSAWRAQKKTTKPEKIEEGPAFQAQPTEGE